MSSLTRQLITEARVEALELLVARLVTDAVLRAADPAKALRNLKAAADELGDDTDHSRQIAMLNSSKRALSAANAKPSAIC